MTHCLLFRSLYVFLHKVKPHPLTPMFLKKNQKKGNEGEEKEGGKRKEEWRKKSQEGVERDDRK